MSQSTNVYSGVRAEPRFLRDPTSLEFISSGLSRFSSYVASNLPKRKSSFPYNDPNLFAYLQQQQQQQHQPPPPPPSPATPMSSSLDDKQQQESVDDETDKVTYSTFQKLDGDARSLCLLLGYADGFQVWNIANPDNIHEMCSIRDDENFGVVSYLHILANPRKNGTEEDPFGNDRPLLAVVSSTRDTFIDGDTFGGGMDMGQHARNESASSGRSNNSSTTSILRLYSLKTHRIVKEFPVFMDDTEEEMTITNIQSNDTAIILGCTTHTTSNLYVLSSRTLSTLSAPITDVAHDVNGPVFSLGSRFLAYGTNSPVLNADPVMGQHNKGISGAGLGMLQGDKDVKGAAKDIAKEVVSGVKTLGEFGYNTLSSYFNNNVGQQQQQDKLTIGTANSRTPVASTAAAVLSPAAGGRHDDRTGSPVSTIGSTTNSSVSAAPTSTGVTIPGSLNKKLLQPSGMIMIRDVAKLPEMPTRNMSSSVIAHFRPHTHSLSCLTFNNAGTLLLSASKQGHSFHLFAIMPSNTIPGNVSHLYTLARGYTDAQVEDCHFSTDSMWCSVSTARGTTHVYAINPYGGKPEITGHVNGRVNNPIIRPWLHGTRISEKGTSVNSIARIKQRRAMYPDTVNDDQQHPSSLSQQQQQQQHIPTAPYYPTNINISQHHGNTTTNNNNNNNTSRYPRAKLASIFLLPSKAPYLVNVSRANHQRNGDNYSSSSSTPFKAFKQQASSSLGSMLSSFGSSMSSTDSSTSLSFAKQQPNNNNTQWTSAHDKLSDNRLFGFDEEELSAVDDDTRLLQDDSNHIGYQDMYSIHPRGMLTLHRCWISKSVVRKREQARTIEKIDLVVKQEDVAEWAMARTAEWEQVKIPLVVIASNTTTTMSDNSCISDQHEENINQKSNGKKENHNRHRKRQQDKNNGHLQEQQQRKHSRPWLSHAEIMTYAAGDELPLWSSVQFSLQTYTEDESTIRHKLWNTGEVPASKTIAVRHDVPEPYSRRIDRVGKTSARISSPNEENLDDALAELEDNLSKAMQTTFTTPSPTTLISGSYGSGSPYKRNSNNGYLQQPLVPGVIGGRSATAPSAISFEDAHLINMGSGPSPEDLLLLDPRFSNNSGTIRGNNNNGSSSIILTSSSNGSLIQFEDDDLNSHHGTLISNKDETIRLDGNEDEDVELHHPTIRTTTSSTVIDQVFSPDGDNEMAFPSESILVERSYHHF